MFRPHTDNKHNIRRSTCPAHGWQHHIGENWHNRATASGGEYSVTTEDGRVRPKRVLIEFKKWMCYIDGQKNKYSVSNECDRMLKYNILGSVFVASYDARPQFRHSSATAHGTTLVVAATPYIAFARTTQKIPASNISSDDTCLRCLAMASVLLRIYEDVAGGCSCLIACFAVAAQQRVWMSIIMQLHYKFS
jgi:hypothetical protein